MVKQDNFKPLDKAEAVITQRYNKNSSAKDIQSVMSREEIVKAVKKLDKGGFNFIQSPEIKQSKIAKKEIHKRIQMTDLKAIKM